MGFNVVILESAEHDLKEPKTYKEVEQSMKEIYERLLEKNQPAIGAQKLTLSQN